MQRNLISSKFWGVFCGVIELSINNTCGLMVEFERVVFMIVLLDVVNRKVNRLLTKNVFLSLTRFDQEKIFDLSQIENYRYVDNFA